MEEESEVGDRSEEMMSSIATSESSSPSMTRNCLVFFNRNKESAFVFAKANSDKINL